MRSIAEGHSVYCHEVRRFYFSIAPFSPSTSSSGALCEKYLSDATVCPELAEWSLEFCQRSSKVLLQLRCSEHLPHDWLRLAKLVHEGDAPIPVERKAELGDG